MARVRYVFLFFYSCRVLQNTSESCIILQTVQKNAASCKVIPSFTIFFWNALFDISVIAKTNKITLFYSCRVLQNPKESWRILQNFANHCRIMQNPAKWYLVSNTIFVWKALFDINVIAKPNKSTFFLFFSFILNLTTFGCMSY